MCIEVAALTFEKKSVLKIPTISCFYRSRKSCKSKRKLCFCFNIIRLSGKFTMWPNDKSCTLILTPTSRSPRYTGYSKRIPSFLVVSKAPFPMLPVLERQSKHILARYVPFFAAEEQWYEILPAHIPEHQFHTRTHDTAWSHFERMAFCIATKILTKIIRIIKYCGCFSCH